METSSLKTPKIMPRNINEIVQLVHEIGFRTVCRFSSPERRRGSILEYQAMPSWRDVFYVYSVMDQAAQDRYGLSIRYKITTCSLSGSQLGWPPCWTIPLAFGLTDWSSVNLARVFLLKSFIHKIVHSLYI
jgi:hypothetical protein